MLQGSLTVRSAHGSRILLISAYLPARRIPSAADCHVLNSQDATPLSRRKGLLDLNSCGLVSRRHAEPFERLSQVGCHLDKGSSIHHDIFVESTWR
jgi:hypothetical protein